MRAIILNFLQNSKKQYRITSTMDINSPTITYILLVIVAILTVFIVRLEIRMKKLLRGNKMESMEDTIIDALEDIDKLGISKKEIEKEIVLLKEKIKKNIQSIGTVRFNPFSDVGGKQSFASAFIDEHGDGVVLSSLYSRDKVSVFAKPVKEFKSEYELSGEEKEALKIAWENNK